MDESASMRILRCTYPAFAIILVFLLGGCEKKQTSSQTSSPEVQVVDVVQQDVPIYSEWVAQLNGDTNAQIVPKVQGYVLRRNYREGSPVSRGELLFEIDPRPFQAALDQANAQLASAEASLSKAQTDVIRDEVRRVFRDDDAFTKPAYGSPLPAHGLHAWFGNW